MRTFIYILRNFSKLRMVLLRQAGNSVGKFAFGRIIVQVFDFLTSSPGQIKTNTECCDVENECCDVAKECCDVSRYDVCVLYFIFIYLFSYLYTFKDAGS